MIIEYDSFLQCYTFEHDGELLCLGAETLEDAQDEAQSIIDSWE